MAERRPLRAVHTSDVHLGAYPLKGDERTDHQRDLMHRAFSNVIDLGNSLDADLLLIAGDFFDNDRVHPDVIEWAAREINRFQGRAYLCPGNHDPVDPGRIYNRHAMEAIAPRLRIIREHAGQVIDDPDLPLAVWGRGYLESDWHFRPLDGIPARVDDRWHIAMAHGHFVRPDGDFGRSLLIHEHEIAAQSGQWDYLALGHWEPHADVSSGGMTAIYSGAPHALGALNRNAGWASVVDFDARGVSWRVERVDPSES